MSVGEVNLTLGREDSQASQADKIEALDDEPSRASHQADKIRTLTDNPVLAMIFKHDNFLRVSQDHGIDNLFVGKSLEELYQGNKHLAQGKQHYIALVTLDWEEQLASFLNENTQNTEEDRIKMLRDCLQDHSYNPATCEATIHNSKIVLNIWNWAKSDDYTAIYRMKDNMLVDDGAKTYKTYSMYANPRETELPTGGWEFHGPEWDGKAFQISCRRPGIQNDKEKSWVFEESENND